MKVYLCVYLCICILYSGITLVAAAGDNGVQSALAKSDQQGSKACGYQPQYPASCPYVTTIGATQGPESNVAEVCAQSDLGAGMYHHIYVL
jgi:subtilase family serine protease